jgi:hypothetical protein
MTNRQHEYTVLKAGIPTRIGVKQYSVLDMDQAITIAGQVEISSTQPVEIGFMRVTFFSWVKELCYARLKYRF